MASNVTHVSCSHQKFYQHLSFLPMRKQAFSLGLGVAPRYPPCKPEINHLTDFYAVSSRDSVLVQGHSFMAAARIQDKTTPQHKLFSNPTLTLGMHCKYRSFNFFSNLLSIYLLPPLSSLRYKAFQKKICLFCRSFLQPHPFIMPNKKRP